jgi:hypothetical protein
MTKVLKFKEALEILNSMHFGARVVRSGRRRGVKEIWWVTLDGASTYTPFSRETTWEKVIEHAKLQLPVWDRARMFVPGDIIEFDWQGRTQAIVVDFIPTGERYVLKSEVFDNKLNQRDFGNYDLKFHKNAVKVGELEF